MTYDISCQHLSPEVVEVVFELASDYVRRLGGTVPEGGPNRESLESLLSFLSCSRFEGDRELLRLEAVEELQFSNLE